MTPRILNWFLEPGGYVVLAPLPPRVDPVLQYIRDRPTLVEGYHLNQIKHCINYKIVDSLSVESFAKPI